MLEHIPKSLMEQFRDRSLDAAALSAISAHLESCAKCYELFREAFHGKSGNASAWFSLSSESWLKGEHLEYEQIVSYADGAMDKEDREILDEHLQLCARCSEDVQSFVAHRRQIEPELKIRYAPVEQQVKKPRFADWRHSFNLSLKPAYPVYALLFIGALAISTLLLRRGDGTRPSIQTDTPLVKLTPIPSPPVTITPTTTPAEKSTVSQRFDGPDKSVGGSSDQHLSQRQPNVDRRANQPDPAGQMIPILDGEKKIFLRDATHLAGLDDAPASIKELVKETLTSGAIQRPAILDDLAVERSATRGNAVNPSSFKLISPQQTVVIETTPVFKWEPLNGATGYKVQIASKSDWAGISSPNLSPATLEWTPPTRLRRGATYTWVVKATTEKGDLIVPSSSEPERKFKVLGEGTFNTLKKLKRQTGSRLALGLFYARAGAIVEAERELQLLADGNADSPLVRKWLDQIHSWR
jgi:hypothetical protein